MLVAARAGASSCVRRMSTAPPESQLWLRNAAPLLGGWAVSWPGTEAALAGANATAVAASTPVEVTPVPYGVVVDMGVSFEEAVASLECMNRNAREPKKANHGKRPCSHKNRRRRRREKYGRS